MKGKVNREVTSLRRSKSIMLIVSRMYDHCIDAEIITGARKGTRVLIPRIKLAPSDANLPFILQRTQFPLRLAYCMTINKAQGQTFSNTGLYLPNPVFSHGQLLSSILKNSLI